MSNKNKKIKFSIFNPKLNQILRKWFSVLFILWLFFVFSLLPWFNLKHASASIITWDFSNPLNYIYDRNKIEVINGLAKLKDIPFDTNLRYRQPITIYNTNNSNTLSNYQVKLTLDSFNSAFWSHIESDGRSIRFTDSDKITFLNFWVESFDYSRKTATIWVKIPSIPALSTKTIYLYYGNPNLSSASSGDNTFIFFDDFEGDTLDTNKWGGDVNQFSVSKGILENKGNTNYRLSSLATFSGNLILEIKHKTEVIPPNGYQIGGFWASPSDSIGYLQHSWSDYYRNDGSWVWIDDKIPEKTWMLVSYISYENNVRMKITSQDKTITYDSRVVSNTISSEKITLGKRYDDWASNQTYKGKWDWIRVRQYTEPEPLVLSFGPEEYRKPTDNPTIQPITGQPYSSLLGFSHNLGSNNQGQVRYQISNDGTNWYWWNGTKWSLASDFSQTNTAAEINSHISSFYGPGTFYFKAYLSSDGRQLVELDSVQIECNQPPNSPTYGFSPASNQEITNPRPIINWADATDPNLKDPPSTLRYVLQLGKSSDWANYKYQYTTLTGISFYEVPDILDEGKWYWRVKTVDKQGAESIWSPTQSFWINAVNSSPEKFNLLSPSDGKTDVSLTPVLDWQDSIDLDPYDVISYTILIDNDSNFSSPVVKKSGLTSSFYSVVKEDGLVFNTKYYWKVKASDNKGASRQSSQIWSFITTSPPKKSADINQDGKIDTFDFSILLSNWGNRPFDLKADLNSDGYVDTFDFSILLSNWTG